MLWNYALTLLMARQSSKGTCQGSNDLDSSGKKICICIGVVFFCLWVVSFYFWIPEADWIFITNLTGIQADCFLITPSIYNLHCIFDCLHLGICMCTHTHTHTHICIYSHIHMGEILNSAQDVIQWTVHRMRFDIAQWAVICEKTSCSMFLPH